MKNLPQRKGDHVPRFAFAPDFRSQLGRLCADFPRAETNDGIALKRAAIAITIVDSYDKLGHAAFLLTRRATSLRFHSAQWALPGGRCDPHETPSQTALRELHEELGINLNSDLVLGAIDNYPTRSGYLITPIIVWGDGSTRAQPNPDEVASVHCIRLDELFKSGVVEFSSSPETDQPLVRLRIEGDLIYAPTAAILYQFRELLAGRVTRVAHFEQPKFAWR
jgi:8-oxo-dGTP pyrophosphatase MutT (NUDIX family)